MTGLIVADGQPQRVSIVCANGIATLRLPSTERLTMSVGSSAVELADLIFFSSLTGFGNVNLLIDRALSYDEETMVLNS